MGTQYQPSCCGISLRTTSLAFAGFQQVLALVSALFLSFFVNRAFMLLLVFAGTAALGIYGIKKNKRNIIGFAVKVYWVEFVIQIVICAVAITVISFLYVKDKGIVYKNQQHYYDLKRLYNNFKYYNDADDLDELDSDFIVPSPIREPAYREERQDRDGKSNTHNAQKEYIDADTFLRESHYSRYDYNNIDGQEYTATKKFLIRIVIAGACSLALGIFKLCLLSNLNVFYGTLKGTYEEMDHEYKVCDTDTTYENSALVD